MYAQVLYFDGPRSAELIAAAERGARDRIKPAVSAHPVTRASHCGTYVLRGVDGAEIVLVLADTEAALDVYAEVVRGTELLPGEDPALLPGPDRVERYRVHAAYGADFSDLVVPSWPSRPS
jgi:hypothetical protein